MGNGVVIKSDPREASSLWAPDFFQQVWINGVAVEGLTIKTTFLTVPPVDHGSGTAVTLFALIRPGEVSFCVYGYRTRGMAGNFVEQ
ncbi:MAG: hypothetical protein ABSC22_04425 [Roseiarcus sp.]